MSWHGKTCGNKGGGLFSISRIYNCFNVFSKSKALHGIIFQGKSFTTAFCKPCKLFVNLWTFNFCSVQKVSNGFKCHKCSLKPWIPIHVSPETRQEFYNIKLKDFLLFWARSGPTIFLCCLQVLKKNILMMHIKYYHQQVFCGHIVLISWSVCTGLNVWIRFSLYTHL